jgi:uncharacterized protein with GYD domain
MPKYAVLWKFTDGAIQDMVNRQHPSPVTTRNLVESVAGNLEAYYWIVGSSHDGVAIIEFPDASTASAFKLAFRNASVIEHIETYELIAVEDIQDIMRRVGDIEFPP